MTNNTNHSNVATLIRQIMSTQSQSDGQQAKLTVEMARSEVSFSIDVLNIFFGKSGKERTEWLDDVLCGMSPDYESLINSIAAIRENNKGKGKLTGSKALELEASINKVKAARIKFDRAARAVYYLRNVDAEDIRIQGKAISYDTPKIDSETGDIVEGKFISNLRSANELTTLGSNLLKPKKDKAENGDSVEQRKPITVEASEHLTLALRKNSKPIPDYNDQEEAALVELYSELTFRMFADDKGRIDARDVTEWLEANFKHPAGAVKGNGKSQHDAVAA